MKRRLKCHNFLCHSHTEGYPHENCRIVFFDVKKCESRKAFKRINRRKSISEKWIQFEKERCKTLIKAKKLKETSC